MIFITSGHNLSKDSGAIGVGGVKEAELTIELRDLIARHIPKDILWVDNDLWDVRKTASAIEKYPSKEDDIICDIHFNSSDNPKATGCEVIIPNKHNDKEMSLANTLCEVISTILGIKNRGVKTEEETPRKRLAMLRPKGINVLPEICFLSNISDLSSYNNHKHILAEEVAKKLLDANNFKA